MSEGYDCLAFNNPVRSGRMYFWLTFLNSAPLLTPWLLCHWSFWVLSFSRARLITSVFFLDVVLSLLPFSCCPSFFFFFSTSKPCFPFVNDDRYILILNYYRALFLKQNYAIIFLPPRNKCLMVNHLLIICSYICIIYIYIYKMV